MNHAMVRIICTMLACVGLAAASANSWGGPKSTVGRSWPAGQLVSMNEIDHATWDQLLQKYVDDEGYVNYRAWHASAADRALLQQYLVLLSRADPSAGASRESQLAYWINAYNAVTIEGILQKYPTDSIRDHTAKVFGYNIWHDLLLIVGNEQVSLDHMEHKILRPMNEPRVHFAIVCASIGCPRLLSRAYRAGHLDEQLNANARHFFADPTKLRVDVAARRVDVSPILDWFAEDFGDSASAQLRWMAPFFPADSARQLAASGQARLGYLDYNWQLNER